MPPTIQKDDFPMIKYHTTNEQPPETIGKMVTYKNWTVSHVDKNGQFHEHEGRWHYPMLADELLWNNTPTIGRIFQYRVL